MTDGGSGTVQARMVQALSFVYFTKPHKILKLFETTPSSSSTANMEASPLNRLPGEIRNNIYEYVLVSYEPVEMHTNAALTEDASDMFVEDESSETT